jgi:hypothetical protein
MTKDSVFQVMANVGIEGEKGEVEKRIDVMSRIEHPHMKVVNSLIPPNY